jgi:hypothetical protein
MGTAASTAQNIQHLYAGVSFVRCLSFAGEAWAQHHYGAVSQIYPNGTREWNVFACDLEFTDGNYCFSIVHITGQQWWAIRLDSFPGKSACTPYELTRLPVPAAQ